MMQHVVGRAAEDHILQAVVTDGPHDNQVAIQLPRHTDDIGGSIVAGVCDFGAGPVAGQVGEQIATRRPGIAIMGIRQHIHLLGIAHESESRAYGGYGLGVVLSADQTLPTDITRGPGRRDHRHGRAGGDVDEVLQLNRGRAFLHLTGWLFHDR